MNTSDDSSRQQPSVGGELDDVDALISQSSEGNGRCDAEAKRQINEENKKADNTDRRQELIVVGALLGVSIIDGFMFAFIENWTAPIVIGILQLFAALIFAKNYGVTEIQLWLTHLLDRFPHQPAKPEEPKGKDS